MIATVQELVTAARQVQGDFHLAEDFIAGEVGAAIRTKSGRIFTGICIDVSCGIGFCVEHAAVAEMLKSRETEIDMIVAATKTTIVPPCGRCRELLVQVDRRNLDCQVILSETKMILLRDLLPEHWFAG